jgi:hypothetical protein
MCVNHTHQEADDMKQRAPDGNPMVLSIMILEIKKTNSLLSFWCDN